MAQAPGCRREPDGLFALHSIERPILSAPADRSVTRNHFPVLDVSNEHGASGEFPMPDKDEQQIHREGQSATECGTLSAYGTDVAPFDTAAFRQRVGEMIAQAANAPDKRVKARPVRTDPDRNRH